MLGVTEYEKLLDSTSGHCRSDADSIALPEWVAALQEVSKTGEKVLMNWWPESACKREQVVYKTEDLVSYTGEQELGIWRDAKHGVVSGVIKDTISTKKQYSGSVFLRIRLRRWWTTNVKTCSNGFQTRPSTRSQ